MAAFPSHKPCKEAEHRAGVSLTGEINTEEISNWPESPNLNFPYTSLDSELFIHHACFSPALNQNLPWHKKPGKVH